MQTPISVREPPSGRSVGGWSRQRIAFLAISGALTLALLAWTAEVLLPFILALIIAYVLTPAVAFAERYRVPRAVAILLVYTVTIGTIYLSIATIAPRLYLETMKLARDTPTLVRDLSEKWGPRTEAWVESILSRARYVPSKPMPDESGPALHLKQRPDGAFEVEVGSGIDIVQTGPGHWRVGPVTSQPTDKFAVSDLTSRGIGEAVSYIKRNALELILLGQAVVKTVARGIFLLFMTLMVAGYIMATRESILGFFRSLVPARARIGFDRLLWRIDRGMSGVVRGQLLICVVNGVLSAIGFWMFGLKYWPILAIVAAVMSIIPIFGSILSSVPAVLIGLTQDFWTALWVLLWILGIHQIEANLLNPKIIGVAAKIHPVLVVMSLLIGEHFFGLWGALLAVPTLSLAQSIFNHFRFETMPDAPPDSLLPPPAARA